MISYVKGDIFQSYMQTIVNPVNCVGVMGAGLAKEFKERFPEMYKDYRYQALGGNVHITRPHLWKDSTPWILNLPTKVHWRDKSDIGFISLGLDVFERYYSEWGITSVAFPALGCGLGGLSWGAVHVIMEAYLRPMTMPIEIYLPF